MSASFVLDLFCQVTLYFIIAKHIISIGVLVDTMEYLSKFIENLDTLLFDHQMNIPQLSVALGLNEATFYKFFKKTRQPAVDTLIRVADFFGCSIEFLIGREPERAQSQYRPCPPFSERLEALVKGMKCSKRRFCAEAGITRSVFYAWQTGKSVPSLDYVIKLADYFGYTVDYILGREK